MVMLPTRLLEDRWWAGDSCKCLARVELDRVWTGLSWLLCTEPGPIVYHDVVPYLRNGQGSGQLLTAAREEERQNYQWNTFPLNVWGRAAGVSQLLEATASNGAAAPFSVLEGSDFLDQDSLG